MIECSSKYYRTTLTSLEEKMIYDTILSGMRDMSDYIAVNNKSYDPQLEPIAEIVEYVLLDNPGLFYVDTNDIWVGATTAGLFTKIGYRFTRQETMRIETKAMSEINRLLCVAEENKLTNLQKELFFHDYLATGVDYEKKDMDYFKAHSVIGPLIHHRSVCEGYSKAFKLLCDAAGISCIVVNGSADEFEKPEMINHSWNIVRINGHCCHVDVTWDNSLGRKAEASHRYFNLTDQEMSKDHWWDREALPICN